MLCCLLRLCSCRRPIGAHCRTCGVGLHGPSYHTPAQCRTHSCARTQAGRLRGRNHAMELPRPPRDVEDCTCVCRTPLPHSRRSRRTPVHRRHLCALPLRLGRGAQAMVAGCTMVLKPSPYTPLATSLLAKVRRTAALTAAAPPPQRAKPHVTHAHLRARMSLGWRFEPFLRFRSPLVVSNCIHFIFGSKTTRP
jgi:hypothetical protein